jgi:hypothetical protein
MNDESVWSTVVAFVLCGVGLFVVKVFVGIALRERPDPETRFRGFEVLPAGKRDSEETRGR